MPLRVGIDLVSVERIAESLARFGERFLARVFTPGEVAYATAAPERTAERLAARFAAKEAAFKALAAAGVADVRERGIGWRQIEVRRTPAGACELDLHGEARACADAAGLQDLAVSLSHEGDLATAVVVADFRAQQSHS